MTSPIRSTLDARTARTRRGMLALGPLGAGAAWLTACGATAAPSGAGQSSGAQKLSGSFEFWQPWPIEQPTHGGPIGWKQLSENYNMRGGPTVKVLTPAGNLETAVQTAFAAGTPPDGWQAAQNWVPVWAAKGFSAPLDDLIKRDKWDKGQIFNSAYDTMTWSGKIWAMMQHPDIVFNWLSVSLMEENGISTKSLPTTWPQLDELTIKLTKKTGPDRWDYIGSIPNLWTGWQYVLPQANGARLVSEDGRRAELDAASVAEAIEWVKGHITRLGGVAALDAWRKSIPGGDNHQPGNAVGLNDVFGQKKMGYMVGGNWTADNIRRWNRKMTTPLKFATTAVPSGPKGPKDIKVNVFSGGILEVAQKSGPKLEQMWDFMKYTASKEGGYWVQLNTSDVCASREGAKDPRIVDNPDTGVGRKDFLPLFDTGTGTRTIKHPAATEIQAEFNKPVNAFIRDEIGSIRDSLKEANQIAQTRIDEFWSQNPNAGK